LNKNIKLLYGDATNGKQKLNNLLETNIRLVVVSAFWNRGHYYWPNFGFFVGDVGNPMCH